jgi:hypothetical protein
VCRHTSQRLLVVEPATQWNIAASAPVLALTRSSAAAPARAPGPALAELDPAFTPSLARNVPAASHAPGSSAAQWSEQRFAGAAGFPRRVPRACVPPRRASVHKRQLERPGEGGRPLLNQEAPAGEHRQLPRSTAATETGPPSARSELQVTGPALSPGQSEALPRCQPHRRMTIMIVQVQVQLCQCKTFKVAMFLEIFCAAFRGLAQ